MSVDLLTPWLPAPPFRLRVRDVVPPRRRGTLEFRHVRRAPLDFGHVRRGTLNFRHRRRATLTT